MTNIPIIDPDRKVTQDNLIKVKLWHIVSICFFSGGVVFMWCKTHYEPILLLKDATIQNLKESNERLKEIPEGIDKMKAKIDGLNKSLQPLLASMDFDPINGKLSMNGWTGPTKVGRIFKEGMQELDSRNLDEVLVKANQMEDLVPGFIGAEVLRFEVNRSKNLNDEALKNAQNIVDALPEDNRDELKKIYVFLIKYYKKMNQRASLENILRRTIELWPNEEIFKEIIQSEFNYLPSLKN